MKLKKKILFGLGIAGLLLTSCGNENFGITQHFFNKIHIYNTYTNEVLWCGNIRGWANFHDGVEVYTYDGGTIWAYDGCYFLINGACPFCNK